MSTSPAPRRSRRRSAVDEQGDDWYSKSSFNYRSNRLEFRGGYQTIGERFNDEMGFVPRRGVNNGELHLGARFRPELVMDKWLAARDLSALADRELHRARGRPRVALHGLALAGHLPQQLVHRGRASTRTSRSFARRSRSTAAATSRSCPGRYEFNEYFLLANTNAAAPLAFNTPLLDRRLLRRLPARLHGRHDGARQRALQRLGQRPVQRHRRCRRARSRRRWSPAA